MKHQSASRPSELFSILQVLKKSIDKSHKAILKPHNMKTSFGIEKL